MEPLRQRYEASARAEEENGAAWISRSAVIGGVAIAEIVFSSIDNNINTVEGLIWFGILGVSLLSTRLAANAYERASAIRQAIVVRENPPKQLPN